MKWKGGNERSWVREKTGKEARAVYRGRCKEKRKERGGGDGGKRRPWQCVAVGVKRGGKKGEVGTVGKGGHGSV